MNFMVLWGVIMCILAHRYEHFKGTCCLFLQGNQASENTVVKFTTVKNRILDNDTFEKTYNSLQNIYCDICGCQSDGDEDLYLLEYDTVSLCFHFPEALHLQQLCNSFPRKLNIRERICSKQTQ